jgi:hypothetical protein
MSEIRSLLQITHGQMQKDTVEVNMRPSKSPKEPKQEQLGPGVIRARC